ncbi:MAG: VWA domain-containing protein, partial [Spirochaetales bacterium]|nr:VWA domain-containing protein [Spirochaetales bacterium]
EVIVQALLAPVVVNSGQVHDITALIQSERATNGLLYIFKDGEYLGEEGIHLEPGINRYTYSSRIDESGAHMYEVYIRPDSDTIEENNIFSASVLVKGDAAVLYVSNEGEAANSFLSALSVQGISAKKITPAILPKDLQSLMHYDAIIFDNVPAFDLSLASMELIERYVRDSGGGFLMLGGDKSFGIGGYFNTPVERALPVDMDVTSSMNIPSLALFLVIDKSGSMGDIVASGQTKLDLVKEAVIASVEILNPFYKVGLLAFDADFEWTVEPIEAGSKGQIIEDMRGLAAGGGTKLYPALVEAFNELKETPAAVKHLLILSDGLTDEEDFESIAKEIRRENITISTISVGGDSDRELLSMMAEQGGGRSYFTDDIQRIPRIFASESIIVSRGLIVEESFVPQPGVPSEITNGTDLPAIPPLRGFVLTYPKTGAQQVLSAFNGSPLLSIWRYGLGKSAAYTSDFRGKWGRDLLNWDDFPVLAAQLIRWLKREQGSGYLKTAVNKQGSSGTITIDAIDENDNFINGLELEALILGPDGRSANHSIIQSAPGLYELDFETGESGDYFVTVYNVRNDLEIPPETHILTIPYPSEYLKHKADGALLTDLAVISGGRVLSSVVGREDILFSDIEESPGAYLDLWRYFLMAALLLFLIDITSRHVLRSRKSEDDEGREQVVEQFRRVTEARARRKITYDELLSTMESERKRVSENRDIGRWFDSRNKPEDSSIRLFLPKKRRG